MVSVVKTLNYHNAHQSSPQNSSKGIILYRKSVYWAELKLSENFASSVIEAPAEVY